MKNKISTLFILFFLIVNFNSFGKNINKDTSLLKGIIFNTIDKYIDSINNHMGGSDKYAVYVVKIEDTIPPKNECFFSMSFIKNRSELYIVKPTHYFTIDDKIILVRCLRYDFAENIGLNLITDKAKESVLKVLCDDSILYKYVLYENEYFYFFHYKNGILNSKYYMNYDFKKWLNKHQLMELY